MPCRQQYYNYVAWAERNGIRPLSHRLWQERAWKSEPRIKYDALSTQLLADTLGIRTKVNLQSLTHPQGDIRRGPDNPNLPTD